MTGSGSAASACDEDEILVGLCSCGMAIHAQVKDGRSIGVVTVWSLDEDGFFVVESAVLVEDLLDARECAESVRDLVRRRYPRGHIVVGRQRQCEMKCCVSARNTMRDRARARRRVVTTEPRKETR